MTKVVMKFFKGHGPYVKGDIAGFDPEKAAKLTGVARPYNAAAEKEQAKQMERIGTEEARQLLQDAEAEFAERAADLEAREKDLAEREAALNGAPDGAADKDADATDAAKGRKTGKGEPPAQGADAAAQK